MPEQPPTFDALTGNHPRMTPPLTDVAAFQDQMGHAYLGPPRVPEKELLMFRLNFLGEELRELGAALGISVTVTCHPSNSAITNLAEALDALVDLDYVLYGTVLQLGLGGVYEEAWRRVHAANIQKVAGMKATRNFVKDVVKPTNWKAPDLRDLVI